jgi:uncharacterized protein (DUF1499 family)
MPVSPLARIGLSLGLVSVLVMAISPIGYRLGLWGTKIALIYLVGAGVIVAGIALLVSLFAALRGRSAANNKSFAISVAGIAVSVMTGLFPLSQAVRASRLPSIHDITTDTDHPPVFVALAEARRAAPNGLDYKGGEIAAQQKQAYPSIMPLSSKLPADQLFALAEKTARASGWEVAAAASGEGRIEATATSALYGFKDDIIIRTTSEGAGSRLDMRSASRVGVSDIGANAGRIAGFLHRLKAGGA